MATTKFKGQPVKIIGEFIKVGTVAPDFELVKTDLSSFFLKDLKGKNVILNIFPSLDTSVCATSVRKFNKLAASLPDTNPSWKHSSGCLRRKKSLTNR